MKLVVAFFMALATAVVFMSGYSPGVFSGGEGDLDDPLLQKPFECEDLLNIMKAVLQRDNEPGATAP